MDKDEKQLWWNIEKHQKDISVTLLKILDVLKKQSPSTVEKLLTYGTGGAAIIGVLSAVEIIRQWVSGG
jgi:hypothetical protein